MTYYALGTHITSGKQNRSGENDYQIRQYNPGIWLAAVHPGAKLPTA